MENIYSNMLLTLLLTALAATTSAQSSTLSLQGSWQMEAQLMVRDMEQAYLAASDSLPAPRRERLLRSFGSRMFEFNGNGDFSARWNAAGKEQSAQGNWTLSDNEMLSIVLPTGTSAYTLSFPTAGRMVLEPIESTGGMARKLHFVKSKKP